MTMSMPIVEFKPLSNEEKARLIAALKSNGVDAPALLMGRDTSFAGTSQDLPTDSEVINAVKSVPCHYAVNPGSGKLLLILLWAAFACLLVAGVSRADEYTDKVAEVQALVAARSKACPCACGCGKDCGCCQGDPCDCGCYQWYADDDDGCYSLFHAGKQVGYLRHDGQYFVFKGSYGKDLWRKGTPPIAPPAKQAGCST